jgi:hypothetical protein
MQTRRNKGQCGSSFQRSSFSTLDYVNLAYPWLGLFKDLLATDSLDEMTWHVGVLDHVFTEVVYAECKDIQTTVRNTNRNNLFLLFSFSILLPRLRCE